MRSGDWAGVLALSESAAMQFPTHQWWRQMRGDALVGLGRADDARAFYQDVLAEDPTSVAALKALLDDAFNAARFDEAHTYAARGRDAHPDHRWWRQTGGWALEKSGRTAEAAAWYQDLVDRDPMDQVGQTGLLHLEGAAHDWDALFERCRNLLEQFDHAPPSVWGYLMLLALTTERADDVRGELRLHLSPDAEPHRRLKSLETLLTVENHFGRHETTLGLAAAHADIVSERIDMARAYALMGSNRSDEAFDAFEAIDGEGAAEAGVAQALLRAKQLRLEDAYKIITVTHDRFPHDERVWRTAFYLLQETSRFDEAERWLEEKRAVDGATPRLKLEEAGLHRSRMDFDLANNLLDDLLADDSVDEKTRRAALLVRADTARRSQAEPTRLAELRGMLVDDPGRDLNGDYVLIRTHISLGEREAALSEIDELPPDLDSFDANVYRGWAAIERGDVIAAKEHGRRFVARRYYPQIHSSIRQLEQRTSAPTNPGAVVAFAACRDEERRLPDFLRHHRALGVDHFVIVDNNSTDRTSEYLANQEDVSLFYTEDDYVMSGLGMRWINELIAGLDAPHWCLFADVDELLIYPDCETRSIHDFTEDLGRRGFEGAGGYMLDMHGETLNGTVDFRAGDSMVETSPYFTNAYDFQDFHLGPYVDVRGGFRSETLGIRNLQMTKTPLIHSDSGIQFLSSSHETTPGRIAKVATLFLHFKYIGDAMARAEKEAAWTPYMYYGNNTEKLRQLSNGEDFSLMTDNTHRYESSRQLVELGLLRSMS